MTVTKLSPSKRVQGRYYIDLSNGETLRVTDALIMQYALAPERELTHDEYESLCEEAVEANAKSRALRILGARMLSRGELVRRLRELGETEPVAEDTAEWCADMGLIDDAEYARQIVRGYSSRGYGRRKLEDELYKRRIPRNLWADALSELEELGDSPAERAREQIEKKLRGSAPDRDDKRRIGAALARRGFSWDEINEAFSLYIEELDESEENE